jgi:hypothetical protein
MKCLKVVLLVGLAVAITLTAISLRQQREEAGDTNDEANARPAIDAWLKTLGNERRFPDHLARLPSNADAFLSLALGGGPPRVVAAAIGQ